MSTTSNNYRRGRRLEYLARTALVADGYTVIRSAGSKGPVDLVAINANQVRLIQIKSPGHVQDSDRTKLRAVKCPHARREIWVRYPKEWRIEIVRS